MTSLITLDKVFLAYGADPLLDHIKLQIEDHERVCLIGRNGAGKSSLLKIIEGVILPDDGEVWRKPDLKIARLMQELPQNIDNTIYEFVSEGLSEVGKLLNEYHRLILSLDQNAKSEDLNKLSELQHQIDVCNGWEFDQNITEILKRLELNPDQHLSKLSGGWQRRAALAKALVSKPDLLLLDEPTNHLDIEAIQWLEEELLNCNIGLLFITHDRSLLQRLATRIIELDRGHLTSWPGDYENFLRRKEEMLHAENKQNSEFDKKLAQEEKWIRQGIKARRTRNEGRVRALKALRAKRAERREIQGKVNFNVNQAEKSGQVVIEAKDISHSYNNQMIIKNFSIRIMRGDKIGLIGPNGVGKSTLLNILLEKIRPQEGTIKHGTKLQIAYFDQLRQSLDLEKTVIDNVAEGSEMIEINGKNKHIISYLGDFLFTPQRAMTPVKALSGGECNRLVLAKLFTQPANLLVLDEPTNDLDMETLELLEELLVNYTGTLLLVSHDRAFLDNVVTSTLGFEGNGIIQENIGGYQDWLRQRKVPEKPKVIAIATPTSKPKQETEKNKKELLAIQKKIEKLEAEKSKLYEVMAAPDFYKKDPKMVEETIEKMKKLEADLKLAYKKWEELEN